MFAQLEQWLRSPHLPWMAAGVAFVLCLPALWIGLILDDYVQQGLLKGVPHAMEQFVATDQMFEFATGDPERTQLLMQSGFMPWWTWEHLRFCFYRPLSAMTHQLDWLLWPSVYPLMHLHSLLWLALLVLAVGCLYRRIMGPGVVSGLATLLYALDEAHAVPAGWLAARNGLVGAVFGVVVMLLHVEGRNAEGTRKYAFGILAPFFLVAALLSNEGAVGIVAYLLAYAVVLDKGQWFRRLFSLVPYALVVVGWRFAYGMLGYGVVGSDLYVDPISSPLHFVSVLIVRAPIQLLAQWVIPSSTVFMFLSRPAQVFVWISAVLILSVLFWLAVPLLKNNRMAGFWALGTSLSIVPACSAFPQERLLFFVGLGGMGLLALFIDFSRRAVPAYWGALRQNSIAFTRRGMLVMHLVISPLLLPGLILGMLAVAAPLSLCIEQIEFESDIEEKTLVCVNSPTVFFTSYLPFALALRNQPAPGRLRNLSPNAGRQAPMMITRTDAHTLEIESSCGFPTYLVRSPHNPLMCGDVIDLDDMTVTVLSVNNRQWPQRVAFRFSVPLEDPSLVWTEVNQNRFVMFCLPAIGETVYRNMNPAANLF